MHIGPYLLSNPVALAPMAGVTDLPYRRLCRALGAGYAVGEMLHSDPRLHGTRKSRLRASHAYEAAPVAVQIAGGDPRRMASAARFNVERGAQIIDVNMGCPARKVCSSMAGSALLGDETRVAEILRAVVAAVKVPVTLKMRTGLDATRRNGVGIALLAEACGVAALAVHGRTRADRFGGAAEYGTIRDICRQVAIPVFANGDIRTPLEALRVLRYTGAQGLMIGRAAQGNPWIFRDVTQFLETGVVPDPPAANEVHRVVSAHARQMHEFYGGHQGVQVARKHLRWYLTGRPGGRLMWQRLARAVHPAHQLRLIDQYFLGARGLAA